MLVVSIQRGLALPAAALASAAQRLFRALPNQTTGLRVVSGVSVKFIAEAYGPALTGCELLKGGQRHG